MGAYTAGTPSLTYEGGSAMIPGDKELLRRLVLSNFLWEDNFYIDGTSVADQISTVVARVAKSDPAYVGKLAEEARTKHNLRSVPLWIVVGLAKAGKLTPDMVESVVSRPDEMGELISLYWKANGRDNTSVAPKKLSKALQKGIAASFSKFDAYQLSKWDRDRDISIKDVMFLTHPKAKDSEQAATWKALVDGTLASADTWETALSSGKNKKEEWERLLSTNKLGYQALLMNLRNMKEAGVTESLVLDALARGAGKSKMLPFQFLNAARHAPQWESSIEKAMLSSLAEFEKLPGKTVLLVDISGSMNGKISEKSELTRLDSAACLAMMLREVCESAEIFRFDDRTDRVADRHGFGLIDAIGHTRGGTRLGQALEHVKSHVPDADRIIVFTDEQSADTVGRPSAKTGYIMNVASYDRGVGYGANWTHVNGFSEYLVKFVCELEKGK